MDWRQVTVTKEVIQKQPVVKAGPFAVALFARQ